MAAVIAQATERDLPAIRAIINRVVEETTITFTTQRKTLEDIEKMLSLHPVFVAVQEGQVIGYATFGPFRSGPGYAHVAEHSIALDPAAEGAGIGRALMEAVEAAAKDAGIDILVAGISGSNARAVAFHSALGFVKTGHMPGMGRKFGQDLDLILMQKSLHGVS